MARGRYAFEEPTEVVAPRWRRAWRSTLGRVRHAGEDAQGRALALVRRLGWGGLAWRLLREEQGRWLTLHTFRHEVHAVRTLLDGTLVVTSERRTYHLAEGRGRDFAAPRIARIWGRAGDDAYGLGEDGLSRFDGARWSPVDLRAMDVDAFYADGAPGPGEEHWLVGSDPTHSCIARGHGSAWRREGCSSWYLYLVAGSPSLVVAAGGDGLWERRDAAWSQVEEYGRGPFMPLALRLFDDRPAVLSANFAWMNGGPHPRFPGQGPAIYLFHDGRWSMVTLPNGLVPRGSRWTGIELLPSRRVAGFTESELWLSSPLW